jgi:hypothetical protein
MAVRHRHAQALTARTAAVSPGHVCAGPAFIDEHQALRIEVELSLEPSLASAQDVRPVLLGRMRGLFLRV